MPGPTFWKPVCSALSLGLLVNTCVAAGEPIDFSPVTDPIGGYAATLPADSGAGLLLMDFEGNVVHEQYWGAFGRDTVVPIASATKWLSAGVIASLVDDGLLDLDQPVGQVLPEFAGFSDGRSDMTVRQMFSHSAGTISLGSLIDQQDVTLAESVANLAAFPNLMRSGPGTRFAYGGVSMHIAGRVAEVLGGDGWIDLLDDRVSDPLGVSDLGYGDPESTNPRIAGGAQTSMETYARYLMLLANDGVYDGQRVLSTAALDEMFTDHTLQGTPDALDVGFVPGNADGFKGYGLGAWIERRLEDGTPVEWSSPGAYGTTPWIDFENRYFGVFMVDDDLDHVDDLIDDVRAFAAAAITPLIGDYNASGQVEQGDLDLVLQNWGTDTLAAGNPSGWVSQRANGVIDQAELDATLANWGAATAPMFTPASVPEPAAGLLAGLLGWRGGRRRWSHSPATVGSTAGSVSLVE